ncbi:MAG: hypothetical protein VYE40_07780 [Myxococcota bacterium]|jgi:hypothetical protein|nr:hypothetical protein [Myxococcota bacterium]
MHIFEKWTMTIAAGVILSVATGALAPAIADACGNSMRYETNYPHRAKQPVAQKAPQQVGSVIRAEQAWNKGNWQLTIQEALRAHPTLSKRSHAYMANKDAEFVRAAWLTASAITRANGAFVLDGQAAPEKDDTKRRLQVDWATETLTWLVERNPEDPLFKMLLAESLARTSTGSGKAIELLEEIGEQDLMPDGYGWATLVALYKRAGNEKKDAVKTAGERCTTVGLDEKVCSGDFVELLPEAKLSAKARKKAKTRVAK